MASQPNYFELRDVPTKYTPIDQTETANDYNYDMKGAALSSIIGMKTRETWQSWNPQLRLWRQSECWRILVESGAAVGTIVLIINVIALAVAYSRFDVEGQVADVYTGDCDRAAGIVTGSHFVINVLSSLLLAASNASMQCLGSPSREEVDVAHGKKQALAIGIPSIRNILRVSKPKLCLWLLLAMTSLPLHLFWNSTVFQTLATNSYFAISVTEDFTRGADWFKYEVATGGWMVGEVQDTIMNMQKLAQNSSLQRLERSDCIKTYGQELQVDRRNLLMIVDSPANIIEYNNSTNISSSVFAVYAAAFTGNGTTASSSDIPTYSWMCSNPSNSESFCDLATISHIASDESVPWIPGYPEMGSFSEYWCGNYGQNGIIGCGDQKDAEVLYCLSQEVEGQCKVGLIPVFLIVVCVCNVVKIIGFIWTVKLTRKSRPFITQGDAIESFLDSPDSLLRKKCLVSRRDFNTHDAASYRIWLQESDAEAIKLPQTAPVGPTIRMRWARAASSGRWFLTYFLVLAFLVASASLFTKVPTNSNNYQQTQAQEWDTFKAQGLDTPLPTFTMSHGNTPIILAFFAANIPQLILSYLYITVNTVLTSMLGMAEWTSYYAAASAKSLRVSNPMPNSAQTSSYFLTLPFKWALSSLILFMLLHWLTSQMLFAARIISYNPNGALNTSTSVTGVYYSPLVTICVACLGGLALIALLVVAHIKRFPAGVPLAGNCSASIAAACQPATEKGTFDPDLARQKLRWGVVDIPRSDKDVGHATFSDGCVGRLVPGMVYE